MSSLFFCVLQAVVVHKLIEGVALGVDAGGDRVTVDIKSFSHIDKLQTRVEVKTLLFH